jgi:predicted DNA-binding antitoxin AbrB/MazE fold protein
MAITVEAVYENGVLRPVAALPLTENQKVRLTIEAPASPTRPAAGVIPCTDAKLIEWAALDPELDYPPPPEAP